MDYPTQHMTEGPWILTCKMVAHWRIMWREMGFPEALKWGALESLKQLFWCRADNMLTQMQLFRVGNLSFILCLDYTLCMCRFFLTLGVMGDDNTSSELWRIPPPADICSPAPDLISSLFGGLGKPSISLPITETEPEPTADLKAEPRNNLGKRASCCPHPGVHAYHLVWTMWGLGPGGWCAICRAHRWLG